MRMIATNTDANYPAILFHGRGKDIRLVCEIAPGGWYNGEPGESDDLYWADTARVEFGEVA